jgi:OmcA/MtrC family decaheme c-type cytochrome
MEVAMKGRKLCCAFFSFVLLGVGIIIAGDGIQPTYKPTEKAYYLTDAQLSFVRPGLKLVIQKVEFNPPNVVVTFRISDDKDQGLDRLGIDTPGPLTIGYTLARIRPGDQQYTSYYPIPPNGICQPKDFTDGAYNTSGVYVGTGGGGVNCTYGPGGGTYRSMGDGVYQYTMALKLPANFEANSTTTLGMWASRNLLDFDMGVANSNAVLDFVPSGAASVTQVRDIVTTKACNQCHDPLGAHGLPPTDFDRREVRICILCHTADKTNPETGNTIDEKVFIHKLHMGANLPSVSGKSLNVLGFSGIAATTSTGAQRDPVPSGYDPTNLMSVGLGGKPYQIIVTSEDETFDASTIVWPQDVRNCTTCHQGGTQSDNWKTNPSRAACGSCHDDVNFDTGKNHAGGVQVDDTKCSGCHPADTGLEFDLSVAGAHTIPTKSKQLKGLKVAITGVTNAKAGSSPAVSFTVTDNAGNPVDASKLDRLLLTIAGPTSDYATEPPWQEDARKATAGPTGYTYQFTGTLPKNAGGSWAVGAESFRNVSIPGSLLGQSFAVRESAFNPVFYFSVDLSTVVPRRKVVEMDKCNVCHETYSHHGGARRNTEYCVLCHNPNHDDGQSPPETVNFRTMLMRIHMGVAADEIYVAGGLAGENHTDFGGLRFPADPRNCAKCHVDNPPTYTVPVPDGLIPTVAPAFFYSPVQPTASACLACHNGKDAAIHAFQMTAPFGESCPVCHEEGADFAVTKVHARDEIWPPEDAR